MPDSKTTNKFSLVDIDIPDVPESSIDLVETVYEDSLQPSAKNVGKALSTVTDLLNTIATPIEILNSAVKIHKERFLRQLEDNISSIPPEKVCTPKPEVIGPALEHLKYKISEDTLRKAYAQLCAKASDSDCLKKPLLSFESVLNVLTPLEIILFRDTFSGGAVGSFPVVEVIAASSPDTQFTLASNISNLKIPNLSTEDISVVLDNFSRLGLIEISYQRKLESSAYDFVATSPYITELCATARSYNKSFKRFSFAYGSFSLTPFGISFYETIIS